MSQIKIEITSVLNEANNLNPLITQLADISHGINKQRYVLDSKIKMYNNIDARLKNAANNINKIEEQLRGLKSFIINAAQAYDAAENKVLRMMPSGLTAVAISSSNSATVNSNPEIDSVYNEFSEKFKNATDDADKIKIILELLTNDKIDSATKNAILKKLNMPNFRIDGDKLKVLDSEFNKGAQGLARWYSLDNLDKVGTGTYEKVAELFKQSKTIESISSVLGKTGKIVDKAGLIVAAFGVVAGAAEEYNKDPKASTERKVSNAAVGGSEVLASMAIGAAIGSIVPGPGTVIGAVAGLAVSVAVTAFADWEFHRKLFDGGKKSAIDEAEDGVAEAENYIANGAVK